jgi:hypothetical protein
MADGEEFDPIVGNVLQRMVVTVHIHIHLYMSRFKVRYWEKSFKIGKYETGSLTW